VRALAPLAALLVLAAAAPARAAGLYLPGVGGPGQARAGAYFTSPGDLSAIWYDPAALADLDGVRITYENSFVVAPVMFDRLDDPTVVDEGGGVFPPVHNSAGPFFIPMLGVTAATGRGVTLALAFYAPHAGSFRFPVDGPQRYGTVTSDTGQTFLEAAFGARLSRWVDVGLAAGVSTFHIDETFALHADLVASELRGTDATVTLRAWHWAAPSLGAAIRVHPVPGLTLALTARAPIEAHAHGRFTLVLGEALDGLVDVIGDRVTMTFQMPLIVNAAIGWVAPSGAFQLELAGVWENWSVLRHFEVDASGVVLDSPLSSGPVGEVSIDRGLHDAFSVRLGGEARIVRDRLVGRLGVAWDGPGTRPQRFTASSVDTHKLVAGAGLGLHLWRFDVSLSYMHVFMPTLVVTDSTYTQLNALNESAVTVVGNGTYRASYDVFSVAVTLRLGAP